MLTLRETSNGNTEKDSKTLLTITNKLYKKFYDLAPSASPSFQTSSKHVKKRTWINFLSDLTKRGAVA